MQLTTWDRFCIVKAHMSSANHRCSFSIVYALTL